MSGIGRPLLSRGVREEGSGLQISKLALELIVGLGASIWPILKVEHPTLALFVGRPSHRGVFRLAV